MNDIFVFGTLFAFVCLALACFFFFGIYRGVHDSLSNASIGSVYNFRYFQPMSGDYERFLAKVTNIRKLTNAEINRLNWSSDYRCNDKNFHRSNTLVTCVMADGKFRQFYAERSDMCKRTAVGSMMFKMGVAHLF
jgi:hypothetical protein